MKILITGVAGFIGSHLSQRLAKQNHEVLGIDNLSDYYSPDLKLRRIKDLGLDTNSSFESVDLSDLSNLRKTVFKFEPDLIYHLAAQAGVRANSKISKNYLNSNITGFSNIMLVADEVSANGFIYASTSSVYGDQAKVPYEECEKSLHPNSFYGMTKLVNENLAGEFSKFSKLKMRGVRLFTVYGAYGRPDMAYTRIISSALHGTEFVLYGDGSIKRDFTYIEDVVDNLERLGNQIVTEKSGYHDIVNVGGGNPHSMNELRDIIEHHTNSKINLKIVPENSMDAKITWANNKYLKSLVGETSWTPLNEGIKKTIDWATTPSVKIEIVNWINSTK